MDSRPRRSTLETFNEEMALLDRPLENDEVEYYDEEPPPKRWPRFVFVGALLCGLGFGGARYITSAHAVTTSAASTPSASIPTVAPTPATAPAPAPEKPVVVATTIAPAPEPAPALAPAVEEPSAAPTHPKAKAKPAHQSHHKRHWARLFRSH